MMAAFTVGVNSMLILSSVGVDDHWLGDVLVEVAIEHDHDAMFKSGSK